MPNAGVFIDTDHYLLRIADKKCFIISHVACKYTCIETTAALVFSLYYSCHICPNMNDLAQLEC